MIHHFPFGGEKKKLAVGWLTLNFTSHGLSACLVLDSQRQEQRAFRGSPWSPLQAMTPSVRGSWWLRPCPLTQPVAHASCSCVFRFQKLLSISHAAFTRRNWPPSSNPRPDWFAGPRRPPGISDGGKVTHQ